MSQAAVVNYGPEKYSVELREIPRPEIGDDDVLLEVAAVGVCGSDLHQWTAEQSWPVNYPGRARPRVRRHGRRGRPPREGLARRRPRRQRDGRGHRSRQPAHAPGSLQPRSQRARASATA